MEIEAANDDQLRNEPYIQNEKPVVENKAVK
jgi:hypothetical protein